MGGVCFIKTIECVLTGSEDRFYVLTPIDIILAQKTDCNDHIDWLTKRKRFEVKLFYFIIILCNV